ncbi:Tubulin-specific chaperone cofactor E-like protein [Gryllus bimaculatus]|nr:Tubulin-specific chaperone cofactor E-like protein [Gryllus bimaculatus]
MEELHLSLNELREVCLGAGAHAALRRLFFNRNPVGEWAQVAKLGAAFPRLEALSLADCPLRSLRPTPSSAGPAAAPGDHDDEDDMAGDAVQDVSCDFAPLLPEAAQEHTQYERRQLLIARLPNVRTLNGGGLISSEEREDAERAFIRYYMDKPEVDRPERYNDLVAVHGRLDPLVQVDLSPEKRVKVHVTCGEQSEVRCLHVYQTVADLKQKLESFTGIPAGRMRLFYVDQAMRSVHGPEEMRYPSKRLYSYNIANGDEIIVDVKQRTTERTLSTSSTGSTSSSNNNNSSSNSSSNNSNGSSNGVNNNLR